MKKYKIAVLDDYQNVALESADWSVLRDRADIAVFQDHLADPDAVIERLLPFDVVCVMLNFDNDCSRRAFLGATLAGAGSLLLGEAHLVPTGTASMLNLAADTAPDDVTSLSIHARRSPKRVGSGHLQDQSSNRGAGFWTSALPPGNPAPKQAKVLAMPGHDGLRSDDDQRPVPILPTPGQPRRSDPPLAAEAAGPFA